MSRDFNNHHGAGITAAAGDARSRRRCEEETGARSRFTVTNSACCLYVGILSGPIYEVWKLPGSKLKEF